MKSSNENHDQAQTDDETKLTKKCTSCGEVKSLSEFNKGCGKDGLHHFCRSCTLKSSQKFLRSMTPLEYKVYWMYNSAKARAKKKGIEFTITKEDIKVPELCPCLGVPIQLSGYTPTGKVGSSGTNPYSPSIDRIDNNKGYTPDNIWVVSHLANCIMATCTDPEQIILTGHKFRDKLLSIQRDKQMELDL